MPTEEKKDNLGFEAGITQIEAIVKNLEENVLPLQETIDQFAEGKDLIKQCQNYLDQAKQKVKVLESLLSEDELKALKNTDVN